MARLPYVEQDPSNPPDVAATYSEITAIGRKIVNYQKMLANQPAALRALMTMARYVRNQTELPDDLREFAILGTAAALGVEYEYVHHLEFARDHVGISEEKLRALPEWRAATVFSKNELAVLEYADQVARTRRVDDQTFAALREFLSPAQIVDLTLVLAWYHLGAAFLLPLQVELEH